ncbi:MAG: UbiX family flavin prenyltransferase [Chlamydiia bacterium]|nr:UbiX family flavin prenyltransferase [Chlamydiia bacterium]
MGRYVVGVSGASGIILAYKAVKCLAVLGHDVDLVLSRAALYTAIEELGPDWGTPQAFLQGLDAYRDQITLHRIGDPGATIASGSYPVDGMLVVPCSMATVAALAMGLSDNLLRRAADVQLKERRRLVIVPRETPLSTIHLENMLSLSKAGAVILPPVPAWYSHPQDLGEVEDTVVGRCMDLLGVPSAPYKRWEGVSIGL